MISDSCYWVNSGGTGKFYTNNHARDANTLFMDGSVRWITAPANGLPAAEFKKFFSEQGNNGPGMVACASDGTLVDKDGKNIVLDGTTADSTAWGQRN